MSDLSGVSERGENQNRILSWRSLRAMLLCILGSAVAAIGLDLFLQPAGFAPGGVSGIAVLLYHISHGRFPVGVTTVILNLPLFICGYKVLGRDFTLRSIVGTVLSSVAVDGLGFLARYWTVGKEDAFLVAVWGGLLLGIGYGLIFRSGATTGGTDIAARLLQRRMGFLTLGQLILLFDVLFLFIVAFLYRSLHAALYTGVAVFVSSRTIDIVEGGVNYAKEVFIVSEHSEEIGCAILTELGRGATVLPGRGVYSGHDRPVLWCVIYNRQLPKLRDITSKIDPGAFLAIKDVREANGLYGSARF